MNRSKKGFTLVELLVVIAIIAIIAAVAVPVTITQLKKAHVSDFQRECQAISETVKATATAKGGDPQVADIIADVKLDKPSQYIASFVLAVDGNDTKLTFTATEKLSGSDATYVVELKNYTLSKAQATYKLDSDKTGLIS